MPKHALCIGVDKYEQPGSDLPDCVLDAQRWAAAFTARNFTSVGTLTNVLATKAAVIIGIRELLGQLKYGDLGVLVFSGHGTWVADMDGDEPDGKDEALCCHDVFSEGPLTDDELADIFSEERKHGARLVLIADSCFSGTVSRFGKVGSLAPASARRVRFLPPETFLGGKELKSAKAVAPMQPRARILASRDAVLMAGAQDWEYGYSSGTGGAFSLAALAALDELHSPASYADWMKKIRTKLPTSEFPQNPNLYATHARKKWGALQDGR